MLTPGGDEENPIQFDPEILKADDLNPKVLAELVATTLRGGSTSAHFNWIGLEFGSHGIIYRRQAGKLVRAYRNQLRNEVIRIIWNHIRFLCDARRDQEYLYRFRPRLTDEVMKELRNLFPSKPIKPRPIPPQPPKLFHEGLPLLLGSLSAGSWFPVPGNPYQERMEGTIGVVCTVCKRSQRSLYPAIHYHGWSLISGYDVREHRAAHCHGGFDSEFGSRGYFIGLDPNGKHELTPGVSVVRETPKCRLERAIKLEAQRASR